MADNSARHHGRQLPHVQRGLVENVLPACERAIGDGGRRVATVQWSNVRYGLSERRWSAMPTQLPEWTCVWRRVGILNIFPTHSAHPSLCFISENSFSHPSLYTLCILLSLRYHRSPPPISISGAVEGRSATRASRENVRPVKLVSPPFILTFVLRA
ncbi:hypothetical protein LR48_Vigan01g328900 [Vigna angularis]|uniref:Uncharacterized protein n=1 Tax=Phaseolus angularis TaxID=3914 RepID=A0A0L9TT08_PHAAN|nr:hypothetical protein LR48_Vigan01g328900 [Vigna angularis]